MKCAACGYEYIRKSEWVDDVIRYKSGKRKGEIKSIDQEEVVFEVGYSPFIELSSVATVDGDEHVTLYACPECKTVRTD